MSTTIDLFSEHPPAEPAGDVGTSEPRSGSAATSLAAGGNESSAGQAAGEVGPSGSAEATATRTPLALAAGCCGDCGEWRKNLSGFGFCEVAHAPWSRTSYRAACEFTPSRWIPIDAAVTERREAQARIDRAADDVERNVHGWSDSAFAFVKSFAEANRGKQFISEDIITASLQTDLPQPMDPQAWGRPIQQAQRRRLITKVRLTPNRVPLWEAA